MAHPQSSPRGLFQKNEVRLGSARILKDTAKLDTSDRGVAMRLMSNSTGVAVIVNSTGTTWKYLNTTSKQPT